MTDSDSSAKSRTVSNMQRACLNCRCRCDAKRPVCQQCRLRPPRHGKPCKYTHAPPPEEASTHREDSRDFEVDEGLIFLADPYLSPPLRQLYSPEELSPLSMLPSSIGYTPDCSPLSSPPSSIEQHYTPDSLSRSLNPAPTPPFIDALLSRFAHHPLFFFDPSDFRRFVSLPSPSLRSSHLSEGLMYVLQLWAHRISPTEGSSSWEDDLLFLASHHIPGEIMKDAPTSTQHPHRTLQLIQACILLSLYYLDVSRPAEGRYYCAAATSLALTAGLHRLGSPLAPKSFPSFAFDEAVVPLPPDATRGMEMVAAFWSVVLLNNYWVAVCGAPSCIASDLVITTPRQGDAPMGGNDPADGHFTRARLIEASVLHERTISFIARDHQNPQNEGEFWQFDHDLRTLAGTLGHPQAINDPLEREMAMTAHALVQAALVRLHAPYLHPCVDPRVTHSHGKCLAAARALVDCLDVVTSLNHVDPVLGPLLACAADVYASQLPDPAASAEWGRTLLLVEHMAQRSPLARKCLMRYEFGHGRR
ncbi:hypothetical protein FB45DRAFT_934536 [Roridomyces roridus]|uniref:Xylanolytic transcriptional activator regulatory domain-containing protein n=1 Tax=Roridomyces roridus TaxID=1738132 RepID=A0AAD7BBR5_9AGAR|nr:hypothetical protein FB45DRAFT_934536 [Roridomyces roridus]